MVQFDEVKFDKRKYHMGHSVEGVWVLGGVEFMDRRKFFAVFIQKIIMKFWMKFFEMCKPESML